MCNAFRAYAYYLSVSISALCEIALAIVSAMKQRHVICIALLAPLRGCFSKRLCDKIALYLSVLLSGLCSLRDCPSNRLCDETASCRSILHCAPCSFAIKLRCTCASLTLRTLHLCAAHRAICSSISIQHSNNIVIQLSRQPKLRLKYVRNRIRPQFSIISYWT